MTFSACCTTPSRQLRYAVASLFWLFVTSMYASRLLQQPATPSPQQTDVAGSESQASPTIQDLIASNTLQRAGKVPFHLVMSFQIFDLDGKPSEQGKLEYWWGGPNDFDLTIEAPSVGSVHNVRLDQVASAKGKRALFLMNELLDDMRFPASSLQSAKGDPVMVQRAFGTNTLECAEAPSRSPSPHGFKRTTVCTDETSGTVRLIDGQDFAITRNRIGMFAGTHVATDLAMMWDNRTAIRGHVEKLEKFTPVKASAAQPAANPPLKPYARLAGGVVSDSKISGEPPQYPASARSNGIEGTVILLATISPEGRISDLVPLASPDSTLTEASLAGVKSWSYHPYLLNGAPVEVSTTVTVHFTLNHR